jgi:hypothetical protein
MSKNHTLDLEKNSETNFGAAYNKVMRRAFEKHEAVIVCNDDIVFTPDTFSKLQEEFSMLHKLVPTQIGYKVGWVGARSDLVSGRQNVRTFVNSKKNGMRYAEEERMIPTNFIAPICAAIAKDSWIPYEPINYFSDNINCKQMEILGFRHFVSTAYVHHVGSSTIGSDGRALISEAMEYINTRPDLLEIMEKI